jgi:Leucine-rich repeat (LRR) protein
MLDRDSLMRSRISLTLSRNSITDKQLSFIPIHFTKKNHLQSLTLSRNSIRELPRNLEGRTTLVLSRNYLRFLSSNLIEDLLTYPALENLDLPHNYIHKFPAACL